MEKKKVAGAGRIDPDPDPTLEKNPEYLTQKNGIWIRIHPYSCVSKL